MVTDINNNNNLIDVPIKINQDANISVIEIENNININLIINSNRQGYLLCIEGSIEVIDNNNQKYLLNKYDAAEIYGSSYIIKSLINNENAHLLLIEMSFTGKGRTDI